jgi:uncharacterized protein
MPVIASSFGTPILLRNGHFQTIVRALFRKPDPGIFSRERITTPDDDFLDLDWIKTGHESLVIICHGLEGSSHGSYVTVMAAFMSDNGYDILAMNFRSCSGEMNVLPRFYHSGETGDLDFVIKHVINPGNYKSIYLIGFSIGGNVILKYLGEQSGNINPAIKRTVTFSVPVHLASSAARMNRFSSKLYLSEFLKSLKSKIVQKNRVMPNEISIEGINEIKSFEAFDEKYTAPLHGFKNAAEYYKAASSLYYLDKIKIPILIVNALDDPFLSPECYPVEIAKASKYLFLEMPGSGGHLGFISNHINGINWVEERALEFIRIDN